MKRPHLLVMVMTLAASSLITARPASAEPPRAIVTWVSPASATETASMTVEVPELTGSYTLTWSAGAGLSGSSAGELDPSGATPPIEIDTSGVPDGSRTFNGTITVDDPLFGEYANIAFSSSMWIDRTYPQVSSATATANAIYPRIAEGRFPASTVVTVNATDATSSALSVLFRNTTSGQDHVFDHFELGGDAKTWLGLDGDDRRMPYGNYRVIVSDGYNETATDLYLTLSSLHPERRTWRRTVTPKASLISRYVGRCSTLRLPSARGWAGSAGYYANTRCGAQTARASAVQGIHAAILPAAYRYQQLTIYVRGAAARSRPRSTAVAAYINNRDMVTGAILLRPSNGQYKLLPRGATALMAPDRSVAWIVSAMSGNRYDVARFILELDYEVLVP